MTISAMQWKPAVDFTEFPKMARLSREAIITEKIDGTNAQVVVCDDGTVLAGSRTRWITPENDNFGFAAWVKEHEANLRNLGVGRHFGEWWGRGIQRGYGMTERRFSLFNVSRWSDDRPDCCHVVPILYRGTFETGAVSDALERLARYGSLAAPGFLNPEGVAVFHIAANMGFKKTILKDDEPKSKAAREARHD